MLVDALVCLRRHERARQKVDRTVGSREAIRHCVELIEAGHEVRGGRKELRDDGSHITRIAAELDLLLRPRVLLAFLRVDVLMRVIPLPRSAAGVLDGELAEEVRHAGARRSIPCVVERRAFALLHPMDAVEDEPRLRVGQPAHTLAETNDERGGKACGIRVDALRLDVLHLVELLVDRAHRDDFALGAAEGLVLRRDLLDGRSVRRVQRKVNERLQALLGTVAELVRKHCAEAHP